MSDFHTHVGIMRDEMISMLADQPDQLAHVITGALGCFAEVGEVIETGQLEDPECKLAVITHLRALADAIESGDLR